MQTWPFDIAALAPEERALWTLDVALDIVRPEAPVFIEWRAEKSTP